MYKLLGCALFLVVLTEVQSKRRFVRQTLEQLEWQDCGAHYPHRPLVMHNLGMTPMPVVLPGQLHFTLNVTVRRLIHNMDMDLTITKRTWFGRLVIPCAMQMGSCTYNNLSALISDPRTQNDQMFNQTKTMFQSAGLGNGFPLRPMNINIQNYVLNLPPIPSALRLAVEGDYSMKVQMRDVENGAELGCLEAGVALKKKVEPCSGWFCFGSS